MKILKEGSTIPLEGYFWIIDGKVVGVCEQVPQYNYQYKLQDKWHSNTWHLFKNKYTVDGNEVPFDYFPRGRVMVDPNYDKDGKFVNYDVMVFLDPCINTQQNKELISDYYNLHNSNCYVMWMGNLKQKAGMDHYTCYNCRK